MARVTGASGGSGWMSRIRAGLLSATAWLGAGHVANAAPPPGGNEWQRLSWHTEQGLPDPCVTALAATEDGFLWVGTARGLARFDGVGFRTFSAVEGGELATTEISDILEDRRGVLWIATVSGSVFSHVRGKFKVEGRIGVAADDSGLARDAQGRTLPRMAQRKVTLAVAGAGGVFALADTGKLFRCEGGSVADQPLPDEPSGRLAQGIWADDEGRLTVWDANGASRLEGGGRWRTVAAHGGLEIGPTLVSRAAGGGAWLAIPPRAGGSGGRRIVRCDSQGVGRESVSPHQSPESMRAEVTALAGGGGGRVWLGLLWNGVWLAGENEPWTQVVGDGPLSQCVITCLCEDHHGSLWVGTDREGLHRVRRFPVGIVSLPVAARDNIVTTSCATTDGSVWVGTDGAGAFRFGPDGSCEKVDGSKGLEALHVCSILEDNRKGILLGTWGGLFTYSGGRCEHVAVPAGSNRAVLALFEDRRGRVWAGTQDGLLCKVDGEWQAVELPPAISQADVRAITEDSSGNVWVGMIGGGLLRISDEAMTVFGKGEGFPSRQVRSLCCIRESGDLWIGTMDQGLVWYSGNTFKGLDRASGIPCNNICSLVEDGRGGMWLATDNGIFGCGVDALRDRAAGVRQSLPGVHLTQSHGLVSRGCSGSGQPVATRSTDGKLWFPNYRGLVVLPPGDFQSPSGCPPAVVESVVLDGVTHQPGGTVRADSGTKRLEFVFTAPDLLTPEQLRFRYRLEGMDRGWVDAGGKHSADYSQLPPGEYRFCLMAGRSGNWSESASLDLQIVPRWWEKTWIRGLVAALLAAVFAAVIVVVERAKHTRNLNQLRQVRAIEQERQRIAANIHDDLGASLTRITLLSDLVREQAESAGIGPEIAKIGSTAAILTRAMDEVVWAIDPEHDSLESILNYLGELAQDLLSAARISCRLELPPTVPDLAIGSHTRHNLLLAAKEALHNSIKHSGATETRLKASLSGGRFTLCVTDNGCGFSPPPDDAATPAAGESRSGRGLGNMRVRLREIDGSCTIRSSPGAGTEICFCIPMPAKAHSAGTHSPPHTP